MSARQSRRAKRPLTPRAAFGALQAAVVHLEGAAIVVSAAVEGIGGDAEQKEAVRYTADRLLQADVLLVREAMDALEGAFLEAAK